MGQAKENKAGPIVWFASASLPVGGLPPTDSGLQLIDSFLQFAQSPIGKILRTWWGGAWKMTENLWQKYDKEKKRRQKREREQQTLVTMLTSMKVCLAADQIVNTLGILLFDSC